MACQCSVQAKHVQYVCLCHGVLLMREESTRGGATQHKNEQIVRSNSCAWNVTLIAASAGMDFVRNLTVLSACSCFPEPRALLIELHYDY